jgi:hypothetical protein
MRRFLSEHLAQSTWESYNSAIQQYLDYMKWIHADPCNPTLQNVCEWITYEAYFIKPVSLNKYITAVKYYLSTFGGKQYKIMDHIIVKRLVSSIAKRFGLPPKDDRESISIELMINISEKVDLKNHDDRCIFAACVIALFCCLRCGEFTVKSNEQKDYLRKTDWIQKGKRGEICLRRCKTDVFGRGNVLKYKQMNSSLDPVFWMDFYARHNTAWLKNKNNPLFILKNGKPLSRKVLIAWIRSKAKLVGFENWKKLNGISFRRGGAQILREAGYKPEQYGVLGRWLTPKVAIGYTKLTDPIVDEFTKVFEKAARRIQADRGLGIIR